MAQGQEENPYDNHETFFRGAPASLTAELDLRILKTITKDWAEMLGGDRKLFIACPVNYETLVLAESHKEYITECQKIPKEHKKFLVFMLLGLPDKLHKSNIQKFSTPLKNHCAFLFAQVPLNPKIDFASIKECRFDAVGVRLKKATDTEKNAIEKLL